MPVKLDPKFIQSEFSKKGWTLLSDYERSSKALDVVCPQGHTTKITWNNFQKGQGCGFCAQNVAFTYDEVKAYFQEHGCELLSETYERSVDPLDYRCSCGHVACIDFGNFRKGRRCQKCKGKKIADKLGTDFEKAKQVVESHGLKLIDCWREKSGKSNRTKIKYICGCGAETEAWFSNFYKVQNCHACGVAKKSGENSYRYDPDRDAVAFRKKFRKICSNMVRRFMKATNGTKSKKTAELLGYTPEDLQEHILNHPDYNSCKDGEWHVDHIFPIQAFLDHGISDLKLVNALHNLRPMPGRENLSKAAVYDKHKFKEWLDEMEPEKKKRPWYNNTAFAVLCSFVLCLGIVSYDNAVTVTEDLLASMQYDDIGWKEEDRRLVARRGKSLTCSKTCG